jgi:hypothetical protein
VGLAVGLQYITFGYADMQARLRWLRPGPLVASGLLLLIANGAVGMATGGAFLAPVDYNAWLNLPLPPDVKLSSGLFFELGIALGVLGSLAYMLDTLGHPGYEDAESAAVLETMDAEAPQTAPEPAFSAESAPMNRPTATD